MGTAEIEVRDSFDGSSDCVRGELLSYASICVLDHNVTANSSPGDWEVYAHERIQFVGIGVETSL